MLNPAQMLHYDTGALTFLPEVFLLYLRVIISVFLSKDRFVLVAIFCRFGLKPVTERSRNVYASGLLMERCGRGCFGI